MAILLYIWAITAMTLFTLAFIRSCETDGGCHHILPIAVLCLAWPCILTAIALVLALIILIELKHAATRVWIARTAGATGFHPRQKAGAMLAAVRHHGDSAKGLEAALWQRLTGAMRAYR